MEGLDQELETYRRELPGLLATHEGDYVLIKGDRVVASWKTQALDTGEDLLPLQPFVVQKIQHQEAPVVSMTMIVLGLVSHYDWRQSGGRGSPRTRCLSLAVKT
jgi:hypothetical protein